MNQGSNPRDFSEIKLNKRQLQVMLDNKDEILDNSAELDSGNHSTYELYLSEERPIVKLWCDPESSITQIRRMWRNQEGTPLRGILGVTFRLTELRNFIRCVELAIKNLQ